MTSRSKVTTAAVVGITSALLAGCGTQSPSASGRTPSSPSTHQSSPPTTTSSDPATTLSHSRSSTSSSRQPAPVNPSQVVGNSMFNGATSIWRDGQWHDPKTALSGPRYVMAFAGTAKTVNKPWIQVYNEDRTPYVKGVEWIDYPCSRVLGPLHITHITDRGSLVAFTSSNGTQGTLNLTTHRWTFSTSPTTAGPIAPVRVTQDGNPIFKGATSVWRDGNWTDPQTFLSGPRYVIAFAGSAKTHQKPMLEVYNEDRTPYVAGVEWINYVCPQVLGTLHIAHISPSGAVVDFTSSHGIQGSFNLTTHHWAFTS